LVLGRWQNQNKNQPLRSHREQTGLVILEFPGAKK
jgi:hypothetical protein